MINKKIKVCSICFKDLNGYGNNSEPINKGECCDDCNYLVIRARINQMRKPKSPEETKKMLKVDNLVRGNKKY